MSCVKNNLLNTYIPVYILKQDLTELSTLFPMISIHLTIISSFDTEGFRTLGLKCSCKDISKFASDVLI